ncbi:RNA polymerase sigma factor [Mesorhizobium silamurunense]|uniref:RNA polymerase sigma factor n=1 Tax=Mesorhizobium silamurunense TaxID=499528 RepID=UPI00177C6C94|nr:sigma-70 family RNA polymerase sigma factor [Mesorhizobium silamurunense]
MKSLAGVNIKGEPYVRPKEVEEELKAVLEWPLPKAFALAAQGHLKPQTLVYLLRNFCPNRPTPAYDSLVVAFFSRIQRSGERMTRNLSELNRERIDEIVKDKVLELIAADRLDIFEMSFKTGAERLYLTAMSQVRMRTKTEISREDLVEFGSDQTGEEAADAFGRIGRGAMPLAEARSMLADIWDRLSENERLAVYYVHQLGLTEKEAGERMNCTDRNVRYLITSARRKALGEAKDARTMGARERVKP